MGNIFNKQTDKHIPNTVTNSSDNTYNVSCDEDSSTTILSILPGFSFRYNRNAELVTDTSCCICFTDYHDDMIMQMLPCNHILHRECAMNWYRKSRTCPLCRDNN